MEQQVIEKWNEIIVSWLDFGLTRKRKQMLIPGHASKIRVEFGGWSSGRDIYLWWNEYGVDKCKKIVSTRWKENINKLSLKIETQPK